MILSTSRHRAAAMLAGLAVLGSATVAVLPAPAASAATATPTAGNGKVIKTRFRAGVKALKVAPERHTGYQRSSFHLWDDADHDCRDTRAEVLASESTRATTGSCTIRTGRWVSSYDGVVVTTAGQLDIDHLVPLAEAWESGARSWSAGKREAYANDLAESRTLIAVTAHANRSKGDRDPSEWQPLKNRCTYLSSWVAVKLRWGLSINRAEKRSLLMAIPRCGNPRITTHAATVHNASAAHATSGSTTATSTSGAGLDPRFDTCADAEAHGYGPYISGQDPEYAWYIDRDGDGIVCE
jgi:hypothetical protein